MNTTVSIPNRQSSRLTPGIIIAIVVALALVVVGLAARAVRPGAEPARLVSMAESAQAMQQAGATMAAHGQAMLDEGRRTNDQDLLAHGEHWQRDGQALVQGGQWMAMNPTAPGSLVVPPSELAKQGSLGSLTQTAQAMLHDPSQARAVDLAALRWTGQAMRAEGQTMAEHGRVMAEEADLMVARHELAGQAATDLRQAAQTMSDVGATLSQNGRRMIDYADQLQRSLGAR